MHRVIESLSRVSAGLLSVALFAAIYPACDDAPEPDPFSERVQDDIAQCQARLDEYAECGADSSCIPDPNTAPFSLQILLNCATSVCAQMATEDTEQCLHDLMLTPGSLCSEAKRLCSEGDQLDSWGPN